MWKLKLLTCFGSRFLVKEVVARAGTVVPLAAPGAKMELP